MPRNIRDIINDIININNEILNYKYSEQLDTEALQKYIHESIVRGEVIDTTNPLTALLKKNYELEREQKESVFTSSAIVTGQDINSLQFKNELELELLKYDLSVFTDDEFNAKRKEIRTQMSEGKEIQTEDAVTKLLIRERQLERTILQNNLEKNYLGQGYDKDSDIFKKSVELDMLRADMQELDQDALAREKASYEEKVNNNQEIDANNSYLQALHKEAQLKSEVDAMKEAETRRQAEERQRQEERERVGEGNNILIEELLENLYPNPEPEKPKKGFFERIRGFFSRKPKTEPAKTEAVVEEPVVTEPVKEETKEENTNEVTKENEVTKDNAVKEVTHKELEEKQKKEKEEQLKAAQERKRKKEEERQRKYRVEFAGKDLDPIIKNSGNIEQLAEQLNKNQNLSEEQKEHLQKRIGAIAKVQALETSRTIKQKNRPPCVKYKDGTILLKNKRHDVAKQSSMNGCWSAVLSDMLGHFGVDLTQEEIRAYRPDLAAQIANNDVKAFMERLNKDETNEINAMADLIQRVVPNVAQHHMSISTKNPANMAVVKETVTDALLNKNSPVAVCYKGHYLSIVGIKGDTLVVQNPDPRFDTKYQKLAINDLFAAGGQVTLDWMEDLKFTKEGACKNATSQWDYMGIKCDKREFVAGKNPNQPLHLKGNEYYDGYRMSQGIEETIYMPKMSFGKEKELEQKEINKNQTENIIKGNLKIEDIQLNVMQNDENEITNDHEHEEDIEMGRNTL